MSSHLAQRIRASVPATAGLVAAVLLTLSACSSGDDANREACDGNTDVLSQISEDASAAGAEGPGPETYTTAAETLDELAAIDGVDPDLAEQLKAGAEAARAEAAGENDDVTEPDRSIRASVDICDDLLS